MVKEEDIDITTLPQGLSEGHVPARPPEFPLADSHASNPPSIGKPEVRIFDLVPVPFVCLLN